MPGYIRLTPALYSQPSQAGNILSDDTYKCKLHDDDRHAVHGRGKGIPVDSHA